MSNLPPPTPPGMLDYASPTSNLMVRKVGLAQRRIMWAILGSLLLMFSFAGNAMMGPMSRGTLSLMMAAVVLVRLALIIFMMVGIYQLASALGSSTATCVIYLIGMIIPLVNLIILLTVNQKATGLLQRHHIKVGLMGPKLADLPQA